MNNEDFELIVEFHKLLRKLTDKGYLFKSTYDDISLKLFEVMLYKYEKGDTLDKAESEEE